LRVAHVFPAILFPSIVENGAGFIGGGDRYTVKLARAQLPLADTTLVGFGPEPQRFHVDGLPVIILPVLNRNLENPVPARIAGLASYDILHVYEYLAAATSVLTVLSRFFRPQLVMTDVGGGGRSLMRRLRLYHWIPHVAAISEFSRSLLPTELQARTRIFRGGIDLERYTFSDAPRKRQVLQVGRIMAHKGINYLVDAACDDFKVVIAGHVVDRAYYDHLLDLSRGRDVEFVLQPDDARIAELYAESAVTVAASVYDDIYGVPHPTSELLGLTLLESMATGTPVVCTAVGGMPEYVNNGATGFVVPPNDGAALRQALRKLVGDEGLRRRMGRAARESVLGLSWEALAAEYVDYYREILSSPRRAR
jgi:glycosyltransferase involved in cell wall biosynthesis